MNEAFVPMARVVAAEKDRLIAALRADRELLRQEVSIVATLPLRSVEAVEMPTLTWLKARAQAALSKLTP